MEILRAIAFFCFVGPLAAMAFEPFYAEFFDLLGWDPESLAAPVFRWLDSAMSWVTENTNYLLAIMAFGMGVWTHHLAKKVSIWWRRTETEMPNTLTSESSEKAELYSAEMLSAFGQNISERRLRLADNTSKIRALVLNAKSGDEVGRIFTEHEGTDKDIFASDPVFKKLWAGFLDRALKFAYIRQPMTQEDYDDFERYMRFWMQFHPNMKEMEEFSEHIIEYLMPTSLTGIGQNQLHQDTEESTPPKTSP